MTVQSQTDPFLQEIDQWLQASGTSATRLGRAALGDPSFVTEVRKGRKVRAGTKLKLRVHMYGPLAHEQ